MLVANGEINANELQLQSPVGKPGPKSGNPRIKWTKREEAIVASNARNGIYVLMGMLPKRTRAAIQHHARLHGVKITPAPRGDFGEFWRGKAPVSAHAHPLVRRLVHEANRELTTLRELAERSGVSLHAISLWRYTRVPRLDNFVAVLNAMGLDLTIITMREEV